jgi:hypothetical protein
MSIQKITIHTNVEDKNTEGIFLANPQWIHLDEQEIQERLGKGERLFKVNVEKIK